MIETLFLDRDGTLIVDKNYLSNPDGVELLPQVVESLQRLTKHGVKLFVVTNQSGIGRGYFKEEDFYACQNRLQELFASYGVNIIDMAFCPHDPSEYSPQDIHHIKEACSCRKPSIGMWEKLSHRHGLDSRKCAMIGDRMDDIQFGINAEFSSVFLVSTGKSEQARLKYNIPESENLLDIHTHLQNKTETKSFYAPNFSQIVDFLLSEK